MDGNKLDNKNPLSGKDLASIPREFSTRQNVTSTVERPCYTKITHGKSTRALLAFGSLL